jgi:dynein heavy chain 1
LLLITAVAQIRKQDLVEIRNLPNPSSTVKLALESICILLNQKANDWNAIRAVIGNKKFFNWILDFNAETIT